MAATLRFLARLFRVSWLLPVCLLPLMLIPPSPQLVMGLVMWYFVLVGRIIGMEHIEVGIGAAPADAFGWGASAVLYLLLCAGIAGVWHVLAESDADDP